MSNLQIDALTNLHDRVTLVQDINAMDKPKLIILNIDSFKDINEYYGNEAGDYVLCEVADILRNLALQEGLNLYRIGADEFALLEDAILDIDRYEELSIKILHLFKGKIIDNPNYKDEIEINVTLGFALEKDHILKMM